MSDLYRIEFVDVEVPINPILITTVWSNGIGGGYSGEYFLIYPEKGKSRRGDEQFGAGFTIDAALAEMKRIALIAVDDIELPRYVKQPWRHGEPYKTPAINPGDFKQLIPYWVRDIVADELDDVIRDTQSAELKRGLVQLRAFGKIQRIE